MMMTASTDMESNCASGSKHFMCNNLLSSNNNWNEVCVIIITPII